MALKLEIITPEKLVYTSDEIESVVLTTSTGEVGILPGHRPLLALLEVGEVQAQEGKEWRYLAVDKGFARVIGDTVSVLAESAINIENIDINAVEEAQNRAQEALELAQSQKDINPAEIEKLEAITRFSIAQRLLKNKRR